jgi:hypothetical protein
MIDKENIPAFDHAILWIMLANNSRFGLSAEVVVSFVRPRGFVLAEAADALDRLEYLADKGLAEELKMKIHTADRYWKITDAGRQYCDEHHLVP